MCSAFWTKEILNKLVMVSTFSSREALYWSSRAKEFLKNAFSQMKVLPTTPASGNPSLHNILFSYFNMEMWISWREGCSIHMHRKSSVNFVNLTIYGRSPITEEHSWWFCNKDANHQLFREFKERFISWSNKPLNDTHCVWSQRRRWEKKQWGFFWTREVGVVSCFVKSVLFPGEWSGILFSAGTFPFHSRFSLFTLAFPTHLASWYGAIPFGTDNLGFSSRFYLV